MQKFFAFFKKFSASVKTEGDDERSLIEKMRDKYRLVLMNDETFEEISSLKLSPLNVYIFFSSLVVGTAFIVVLLLVYTPLKRYIPGYGDFQRDVEVRELTTKVNSLEKEVEAHRRYNENFRKMLTADVEDISMEAVKKEGKERTAVDSLGPTNIARIEADEQLREAVESGTVTGKPVVLSPLQGGLGSSEIPLEQLFFIPPVSGETTATFNPEKDHLGIDVSAPRNTAVKAASDGVVITAGYTVETGHSIAIQHPNNVITMYKHNSVLLKKAGSTVKAGEAIAIIGNSGETSSGPHLHFELWHKGRAVNPADYINFN
ncbi:MAG: M23 family metallopeptidase [Saprospiraceae bacterium]